MNLQTIRTKLNKIDTKLVELLAKRQSYMPAVGVYKKKNGLAINQKDREVAILESLKKVSKEKGMNAELIQKIFKLIFADAKRIQREQ